MLRGVFERACDDARDPAAVVTEAESAAHISFHDRLVALVSSRGCSGEFTAKNIVDALGVEPRRVPVVHAELSKLAARGIIRRVAFGKYERVGEKSE